jgi:hypothetical protein
VSEKIENFRAAKAKLLRKFPNVAVGMGSDFTLQVRVETEGEANVPEVFEGFPVEVKVTGPIKPQ